MRILGIISVALLLAACVGPGRTAEGTGADGWITLFNGRDMSGWTSVNDSIWKVENGILKYTGEGNGWLRTNDRYSDFHVIAEWRYPVAEGEHDSGLFFRAAEEGKPWPRPAYQMGMGPGDNLGHVVGNSSAPKRPDLMHPAGGDWNTYELVVVGDKALGLINGRKAWDAHGFSRGNGYIGWQAEGYALEIRSVRIRRLSPGGGG